jgi:ribosome-associated toxin RatA of RatAB toxin-antitoxin module
VARTHSLKGRRQAWLPVLVACLAIAGARAHAWELTAEQRAELAHGGVVVVAEVDSSSSSGEVKAAVQINASPEEIFRTLTDCEQALEFVPHLERCRVLERAPDDSWQVVEQDLDYGWYLPRITVVFRAEYEPFRRISFRQVRGDLKVNEGAWELSSAGQATDSTIAAYSTRIVPRFFVSRRLMQSSLRRDLPALMRALRARCEDENVPDES